MRRAASRLRVRTAAHPANQTRSSVRSARGTISALPAVASSTVPSDTPSRLAGTAKLRSCGHKRRLWVTTQHEGDTPASQSSLKGNPQRSRTIHRPQHGLQRGSCGPLGGERGQPVGAALNIYYTKILSWPSPAAPGAGT